ncbi:MAG: DUF4129 domain-containing protein [Eubacteriales bacterium]|jgi:hypothetical protein
MQQIKKLAGDFLKCIVEIIMLSLILCVIFIIAMPEPNSYIWVAVLPVFSLMAILVHAVLKKVPLLEYVILTIFSAFIAYLIGGALTSSVPEIICMGILGTVLAIRARFLAAGSWDAVSPIYLYTLFMVFNLIFALLTGIIPLLEPFRPAATVLGPIIVLVGLLSMNQLNIISLTDVQRDQLNAGNMVISKSMNVQNKLLLVVIYAVILAVSCLGILLRALKWLARKLYAALIWLADLFTAEEGSMSDGGGGGAPDLSMLGGDEVVRSPFWERFQEIMIHVVSYLAVAAFAAFLLFMLWKGMRRLIAFLRTVKFGGDTEDAGFEEYVDTKTRLIELKDLPGEYLRRARDWLAEQLKREPPWNELKTVREKVRALYRRAIYRGMASGYRHKTVYTPRQVIPALDGRIKADRETLDTLAEYYEAARYGRDVPIPAGVEPDTVEQINKKL